jgi:hypothetical protein
MLIARDQEIAGIPAPRARDLMRTIRECRLTIGAVAEAMDMSHEEARDLIGRLADAGFVCCVGHGERRHALYLDGETDADACWGTTLAGNALSKARIGKPMPRRMAQELLDGLLERVAAVNADPDGLFTVERVEVFGSFTDSTRDLVGDIDVHLLFDRRVDGDEFIRRALNAAARAEDAGRRFNSHIDRLSFAELDLYRALPNGSPRLDIQFDAIGHEAPLPAGASTQVVYERIRTRQQRPSHVTVQDREARCKTARHASDR